MNTNLNYNKVISTTWDYYKTNWKTITLYSFYYTLSTLIVSFLAGLLAGLTIFSSIIANNEQKIKDISGKIFTNEGKFREVGVKLSESDLSFLWSQAIIAFSTFSILAILVSVFILPFMVNLYDSILKLVEGKEINYFSFNKNYFRIFLTILLHTIIVSLGYILFILPGIYLTFRLYPMILIAINEGLSPVQSMNRAFELTKNNFWNIFLSNFIPSFIYFITLILITTIIEGTGVSNLFQTSVSNLFQILISILATGFFVLLTVNIYKGLINSDQEIITTKPIIEVV